MKHRKTLVFILALLAGLRVIYLLYSPLDLSPDEAHYWEWSRRLALSYYSKGPGVAYVIAFFTAIFGNTAFAVRLGAVFFSAAASWFIYLLGRELFESETTGFYAAIAANVAPIFSAGSILMTTDVLFMFFWASSVYCLKKAFDGKGASWWYLSGVLTGLGFLGKYTMVMILPCVLLFMLLSRKERHWLKRPEPYAASFISLVVSTPVIFWNIMNGRVTIMHTMGQAHIGNGSLSILRIFEFLGSQAAIVTPLVFFALVYGIWRSAAYGFKNGSNGHLLAFFASAPVFIFFILKSAHGKVEANWAIASYVTAFPASVWAFGIKYDSYGAGGKRVLKSLAGAGIGIAALVSVLAYVPWTLEYLGVKGILSRPPYNRVTGWRELGQRISELKTGMDKLNNNRVFIASDTYQVTSELAFYTEGNPSVYNFDVSLRRMNQYDLWPGHEKLLNYDVLYVKGGNTAAEPQVLESFDRCEKELFAAHRDKTLLKEFSIFRCYNFKGMKRSMPATY